MDAFPGLSVFGGLQLGGPACVWLASMLASDRTSSAAWLRPTAGNFNSNLKHNNKNNNSNNNNSDNNTNSNNHN